MKQQDILYLALISLMTTNAGCKSMKAKMKHSTQTLDNFVEATNKQVSYDNSRMLLTDDNVEVMENPVAKFFQRAIFQTTVKEGTTTVKSSRGVSSGHGSGMVLKHPAGDFYFLTCDHVISPYKPSKVIVTHGNKTQTIENKILMQKSFIQFDSGETFPYEVHNSSESIDLALLKLKNVGLADIPYFTGKFGKAKRIQRGDVAYVVGYPHQFGKTMTEGIISQPYGKKLMSTSSVNPGNSGGPLYLLDKGEPVLGGIAQTTYPKFEGMHKFAKVDSIRKYLKGINMGDLIR